MKVSPILFSEQMVKAMLAGNKTMTRRKVQKIPSIYSDIHAYDLKALAESWPEFVYSKCPYGKPGDLLWVRENFRYCQPLDSESIHFEFCDNAVGRAVPIDLANLVHNFEKWRPSIHLLKEAARIWLQVLNVRVERLNQISRTDAKAEGIQQIDPDLVWGSKRPVYTNYIDWNGATDDPIESFKTLWQSINGSDSWEVNPWVWAIEYEVLTVNGIETIPSNIKEELKTK